MNGDRYPRLSVIVPLFGCAETLAELVNRVLALGNTVGTIEVIIVDDASKDGSWQIAKHLSQIHQNVLAIRLPRNRGQHYAVTTGVNRSRGECVATIDCDLEFKPEDITPMMAKLDDSTDCVIARSVATSDRNLVRRALRLLYHRVLTSVTKSDVLGSDLIAYSFVVAKGGLIRNTFRELPPSDPISSKLVSSDLRLAVHDIDRMRRPAGFSGYGMVENLHVTTKAILSSGRGGEIFVTRLTVFFALGSLLSGSCWLISGIIQRDSALRDIAFIMVLLFFALTTISSVLTLALHLMTSLLSEVRTLRLNGLELDRDLDYTDDN